jgi:LCP family protein required for cell wall assembly
MSTTPRSPRAPRTRSAFGAAFLSLIFPGLGHAYAGAWTRALGFAALPLLGIAAAAGIALRGNKFELAAFFMNPGVLTGVMVFNVVAFLYRAAAAVDAWNVARFLNAADASGDGRLGKAKLPLNPLSIAGLVAVVLVMAAAHVAVARYDSLALSVVGCFNPDTADISCDATDTSSPNPSDQAPSDSGLANVPSQAPTATSDIPSPIGTGTGATPAPSLPPWNANSRLNILLVGTDQRGSSSTFNTDTMIVVSVDPKTKQVAMLQLPRDTTNVPVPPSAQSVWGSIYHGKINSWFAANQNRTDLWPGKTATSRGFAALKSILGNLYGININYYVMVNFQGFRDAVDTLGGLQVNVQIPVADDNYPILDNLKTRVYVPAGPQEMDGTEALLFARSRHKSNDYDRGHRQQRVIVSLRNQLDPQAVFANLTSLVQALKTSVKTDLPITDSNTMGQLLDLASQIDTKSIRSYVFAAPFFATDMYQISGGTNSNVVINLPRVQAAVRQAFSISPSVLALQEQLSGDAASVWVQDGRGGKGLSGNNAAYLDYFGIDASAITSLAATTPAHTKITVYNGAENRLGDTIKYLQNLYGVTVTTANNPAIKADIVILLGQDGKSLTIPNVG